MLRVLGCALAVTASGCLMPNPAYLGESGGSGGGVGSTSGAQGDASSSAGPSTSGAEASASGSASGSGDPQTSDSGTTGGEDPAGSSSSGAVDVSQLCPQTPELGVCIPFDVDDPSAIVDESVYANPVEVEGGSLVPSPWSQGFRFDPITRVELDCPDACVGGAEVTFEAWVQLEIPPVVRAGIVDNNGLLGMFVTDALELQCNTAAGAAVGGDVPLGEWVHVACVADGDALVGYVDGEEVAQRTIAPLEPVNQPRIAIGNDTPSFGDPLVGSLDAVRVWAVARTPDEIADAANP